MFDVRGALVELTGVLSRGVQPGGVINIARSYGREMYVLTALQRTGDVEPITLNVLSTVSCVDSHGFGVWCHWRQSHHLLHLVKGGAPCICL